MSYIPPHKRHSKDPQRQCPTPEVFVPQSNRNLNLGLPKPNADSSEKIEYIDYSMYWWFAADLDDDNSLPSSVHLEPISVEYFERTRGEKPLVLVNDNLAKDNDEVRGNISTSPWESVAKHVWPSLLYSYGTVMNEKEEKPTLVARFGKNLFHRSNTLSLESAREGQVTESTLRQLNRTFRPNVSASYVEKVINENLPKIGVDFEGYKDIFLVKLSDSTRPSSIISFKCRVKEDKKIELYKVRPWPVFHMTEDISCLYKNLDLRLSLFTKNLTVLTDDEMDSIRNIINSAVVDLEVKGGLRWPLGESNSGARYRVISIGHIEIKSYTGPSLKLQVRHADWFDFETSIGEAQIESTLKLKRIISQIQEAPIDSVYNVFKDNLKLIWDHLLTFEDV